MGKRTFIINNETGNIGVVKLITNEFKTTIIIQVKNQRNYDKCTFIMNNEEINDIILKRNKNVYELSEKAEVDAVYFKYKDEILAWSGTCPETKKEIPEIFDFNNFFGGNFSWNRIRGCFIAFDFNIVKYVISNQKVYEFINRCGYYFAGIKKENDVTFISIVIPVKNTKDNPFSDINADSYLIRDGRIFKGICMGIDASGEFFISI